MTIHDLPHLNAALNSLSTLLLILGLILIKRRRYWAHGATMIAATATSIAFLVGYLIYHAHAGETRVSKAFPWVSPGLRNFYFAILFPHLLLAIVMVPMILRTLYLAWKRRWDKHARLARPTFWIWLYVSFTGVVIYYMLYHLFPGLNPGPR